jgi:hypothetical protein
VLLLGALWTASAALYAAWKVGHSRETRSMLVDRLNEAGRWRRIAFASELRMHPLDLERLRSTGVVKPMARLLCAPGPWEVVVLPSGFSGSFPNAKAKAESKQQLLAFAGRELLAIGPERTLSVDSPPTDPGISVRMPAPPPAQLPGSCLEALAPARLVTGQARRQGWEASLRPGMTLLTPVLAVPAGKHVVTIRFAGVEGQGDDTELRAAVLAADGKRTLAEHSWQGAGPERLRPLPFSLAAPAGVRVRLETAGPTGSSVRVLALGLE